MCWACSNQSELNVAFWPHCLAGAFLAGKHVEQMSSPIGAVRRRKNDGTVEKRSMGLFIARNFG